MNDDVRIREWVAAWKRAGPELERLRCEQVKRTNTAEAIEQLSDAFDWAIRELRARPSSGLVEQQAIFQRLRSTSNETRHAT